MISKAEELKTLDKIKKLVESVGAESYIGISFEGFFEMVQDNIENDFANSVKVYKDLANRGWSELATVKQDYKNATAANEKNLDNAREYRKLYNEEQAARIKLEKEFSERKTIGNATYITIYNTFSDIERAAESELIQVAELMATAEPEQFATYADIARKAKYRRDNAKRVLADLDNE